MNFAYLTKEWFSFLVLGVFFSQKYALGNVKVEKERESFQKGISELILQLFLAT